MDLYSALNIKYNTKELITLVGAGGKTTTMFKLANECANNGERVLVTTTTAIYYPDDQDVDSIILLDKDKFNPTNVKKGTITVIGESVSPEGKLLGIDPLLVDKIYKNNYFDTILVEADGAKRRLIKAPASYEPVYPRNTTKVIGLVGLDAVGKRLNEKYVHRTGIFSQVTNTKEDEEITIHTVANLISSPYGTFKGSKNDWGKYLILNKGDNKELQDIGLSIVKLLKPQCFQISVILITSYRSNIILKC